MSKFKEQLFNQINPMAILLELERYPEQIKAQKSFVRDLKRKFDDLDVDRAARENEIKADIAGEVDPSTNKAKFSNDKVRQAELNKRIRTDAEYIAAAKMGQAAEMALGQAQDELEMLENKYRSCRYKAEIIAAQLRFWAGDEQKEDLHSDQAY